MLSQGALRKQSLVERAVWEGIRQEEDNKVVVEPSWVQQMTPHAPTAFLNGVYRCELAAEGIEEKVKSTILLFRTHKLPFRWKIGPSSRPSNLQSILLANGLKKKDTLYGLYADPGALKIPVHPEVEVRELSLDTLEDWLKVQATAWKVPSPGIDHLRKKNSEVLKANQSLYQNYIAYYQGEPVASAGLRFFSDYAFLVGAAVNPNFQRHGIYRTLLAYRLDIIGKRNLPAVIHCLEQTSAPICLKLGFEKICEIYSFEPSSIE